MNMNPNPIEESSVLFKQKRDEYLVEIRKKKNTDHIRSKRTKFAPSLLDPNRDSSTQNEPSIPIPELAQAFMNLYTSGKTDNMPEILESLRKAVSLDDTPPITDLIKTGVVPYIIDLISPDFYKFEKILIEASWIATNIVSRESEHVRYLVGLDIIPRAISLIEHPNDTARDNALWILANLAGESLTFRDDILKRGVVEKLEYLLNTNPGPASTNPTVVWLMSNLCRGKPYPSFPEIASFLPYIRYYIKNIEDPEVQINCMWALVYLTGVDDEQQLQEIINMDVFDELHKNLCPTNDSRLITPTLRTIGHIVNGNDKQAQAIIDAGLIENLFPLLNSQSRTVIKEAAWVYSNILGGTRSQVRDVFKYEDGRIIERLFSLVQEGPVSPVGEECIYALTNACDIGDIQEIGALVDMGIIEILIEILKISTDASILKVCLTALDSILKEGVTINEETSIFYNPYFIKLTQREGMEVIERLQESCNEEVAEAAEAIVKQYDTVDTTFN